MYLNFLPVLISPPSLVEDEKKMSSGVLRPGSVAFLTMFVSGVVIPSALRVGSLAFAHFPFLT